MSGTESNQQGFPFHPLQDFVLGEVLDRSLQRLGVSKAQTEGAILSHLQEGRPNFVFTPNAKKQTLMQSLPVQFRTWMEVGEDEKLLQNFRTMIREEGRLDLALELLEWIFTGFEREELIRSLFSLVLNDKIVLPPEFMGVLREEYDKEMRGDLDRLKGE